MRESPGGGWRSRIEIASNKWGQIAGYRAANKIQWQWHVQSFLSGKIENSVFTVAKLKLFVLATANQTFSINSKHILEDKI